LSGGSERRTANKANVTVAWYYSDIQGLYASPEGKRVGLAKIPEKAAVRVAGNTKGAITEEGT